MKAVRIHSYGHSDVLHPEDVPIPKIEQGEVLVRIHDAGVNPVDWKIREGLLKDARPVNFPLTMGQDFAGDIIDIREGVNKFKIGDRVFGFSKGSYAEFSVASENAIAQIPESVDYTTAAALPTAGSTAYQILTEFVIPKENAKILIHGAGGAVGSFLVQIAHHMGAEVIANASADDITYLRDVLRVKRVLDYKTERFEEFVHDVDAVIDLVGGDTARRSYQVIKKGGLLISTVGAIDQNLGDQYGICTHSFVMKPHADDLSELVHLVEIGVVQPRVDRVVPFEQYQEAQDLVQNGRAHGKIILEVQH